MTDQEKPDHWRSLASEIGAEVPPEQDTADRQASEEDAASRETPSESEQVAAPKPERVERPVRPARPRANWMELAEQLGVAPSEMPQATPPRAVPPQTPAEPPEEAVASASDWPSVSVEPPDWLERQPAVETLDEVVLPESVEPPQVSGDAVEKAEAVEPKLPRKRKKRRRRLREPESAAELTDGDKKVEEVELGPVLPTIAGDSDAEPAAETGPAESSDEPPKRRRRGRGGRRKSTGEKKPAGDVRKPIADEAFAQDTSDEEDDFDQDDESPSETEDHPDKSSRKAAGSVHRGIPSWEDAVGVVIEANLENRSKRGGGDGSSRPRRGRGRGSRDKGGRERGTSK